MDGYANFEFDLPGALLDRLVNVLDGMDFATLTPKNAATIPDAQGVYQLFLDGNLVYIGKTDADAGLKARLERHAKKIQHRIALNPTRVTFKAVRIYVFTAIDLETQLIRHYGGAQRVCWNGSGFGSNDPGRERDTSEYKNDHFDVQFPIDIDRPLKVSFLVTLTAIEVLSSIKAISPYVFRFQTAAKRSKKPHPDLANTDVKMVTNNLITARHIIQQVVSQLPEGWQATKLPSHLILYKEIKSYSQGEVIARSI
ncbi:MAG: GIY-YIG nuclease family protein [Chlorobium sp.]|nr:GIY-YIG nuclease family protein [Chlorobium sp.]